MQFDTPQHIGLLEELLIIEKLSLDEEPSIEELLLS
jgi:hypothetical protein